MVALVWAPARAVCAPFVAPEGLGVIAPEAHREMVLQADGWPVRDLVCCHVVSWWCQHKPVGNLVVRRDVDAAGLLLGKGEDCCADDSHLPLKRLLTGKGRRRGRKWGRGEHGDNGDTDEGVKRERTG